MTTKKPPVQEEEIDLGNLFQQIGHMFKSLFKGIGQFFAAIYHYFILFLLFIRRNIVPIGIVTLIGLAYGLFKDYTTPPVYKSEMIVKTNYGSAALLYEKIDEINALLGESDSTQVADILEIPINEVSNIIAFSIEPQNFQKDAKIAYDKYRLVSIDTSYTNKIEFKDFSERFSETDAQYHIIKVTTKNPDKINIKKGIKDIVSTDLFIQIAKEHIENKDLQKSAFVKGIYAFDSIRNRYTKVALMQAQKPATSQDLKISAEKTTERNVDYDLYNISIRWLHEFEKFNSKYQDKGDIITIVSDFSIGKKNGGILSSSTLRFAALGFILALFVLFILQFNKYLSQYEKKIHA